MALKNWVIVQTAKAHMGRSMKRRWAYASFCCTTLVSLREACLKLCLADGDLWNCHSRCKRRFSRTSCSICRLVFFWLRCVFVDWGVETRAAETRTVLTKLSMLASSLRWGLSSMCELTYFLYLTQFLFCDVNLNDCSKVPGCRSRIHRTGKWWNERN